MQKRIEQLIDFIKEYGEDFLDDGTQNRIIKGLEQGDMGLAMEIINSMDNDWIKRARETKKFLIFTENDKSNNYTNNKPFFKANYIDSLQIGKNIPTLRRVTPRELNLLDDFDDWGR